jgi:hypothetical protein
MKERAKLYRGSKKRTTHVLSKRLGDADHEMIDTKSNDAASQKYRKGDGGKAVPVDPSKPLSQSSASHK